MSGRPRLAARIRDELTPRQREVMELLAQGKTNFEIAQELGITLEGAKYHVSEILAKLGVESREEAVTAWRGGERRGWRPAGVFVGLGAGAAAAIVGLAVVLALLGGGNEDATATTLEPGAWLAWVPESSGTPESRLNIVHSSRPAQPDRVFDDMLYYGPAWSPDGRYLAAIGLDHGVQEARLVLFDTADWSRRMVDLSRPGLLFWAPDGRKILTFDDGGALLVAVPSGKVERLPTLPTGSLMTAAVAAWSPDGERVAVAFRGALNVVTASGDIETVDAPPEAHVAMTPGGPGRAGFHWVNSRAFVVVAPPPDSQSFGFEEMRRLTFERQGSEWRVVRDEPGPGYPHAPLPGETTVSGFYHGRSADGTTDVFTRMTFDGREPTSHIWTTGDNAAHFVLPVFGGGPSGGLGVWYDVLVLRE